MMFKLSILSLCIMLSYSSIFHGGMHFMESGNLGAGSSIDRTSMSRNYVQTNIEQFGGALRYANTNRYWCIFKIIFFMIVLCLNKKIEIVNFLYYL